MSKDDERGSVPGLGDKMAAGDELLERALQALRQYHEAEGVQPAEEVERLRLEAEALLATVNEYQRQALGDPAPQLH